MESKNFVADSFIKVTKQIETNDEKLLKGSNSFEFLSLRTVKFSEAETFTKDLEKLLMKLDDVIARMYHNGNEM